MQLNSLFRKGLALAIVVLFVGMSIIPIVGSVYSGNKSDDCYPIFTPTLGQHGWYVSPLVVSYNYDLEKVLEIQSWLNGSWLTYVGPFNITEKGDLPLFTFRYRTVESGNEWINRQRNCPFKVDFDKPWVDVKIERRGFFFWKKYIVTAIAFDNTSGIDYVEFYLNGELQFNDTVIPYQWTLKPVPRGQNLTFKVVAYDFAGNSNDDQVLQPNVYSNCLLSKEVGHTKL